MMTKTIKNAQITNTMLGIEDHNCLTWWIHLNGPGWGQGFGGRAWDYVKDGKTIPSADFGSTIREVLEAVGVEKWEDLPNKYVRVESDHRLIYRIGHITEDCWATGAPMESD